jgi:hypothetical protein
MPTDFEQATPARKKDYSFYGSTGVYDGETGKCMGVCFGYKREATKKHETFILIPTMSRENANKWLQKLKKGIEFKYEWIEEFVERDGYRTTTGLKYRTGPAVRIWYPEPANYAHCVLFGNLCKGISEHAWFCEKHLEDDRMGVGFFTKNWEAYRAMQPHVGSGMQTWPSGHCWWSSNDFQLSKPNFKTRSVKELFERLTTLKPQYGNFWNTCLDR